MAQEPNMKQIRKLCKIVDPEWSGSTQRDGEDNFRNRRNWDAVSAKLLWLKLKPGLQSKLILNINAPQHAE